MEFFLFFNDSLKMGLYTSGLDRRKLFPEPFAFRIVSQESEIHRTNAFNKGYRLYKEGIFEEALTAFENVKESVLSRNWQACCLDKLGAHQKALQLLFKVLTAYPDYGFTQQNIVRCLRHAGNLLEALKQGWTWCRNKNASPFLYYELGNCYAEMGMNHNARSCYINVVNTLPFYLHAGYQIGNLYFRERKLEKAEKCYKNLLLLNPSYQPAFKGLGNLYLLRGLLDEAVGCFEKALRLSPTDPHTLHDLGNAYLLKGEYEKACILFEKALKQREDCETLFSLGQALMRMGRSEEGEKAIKRSVELCPHLGAYLDQSV